MGQRRSGWRSSSLRTTLTAELVERYEANRLTVTRQLAYDPASTKTLDLCLFVNGIPVATAELKNPLTGQTCGARDRAVPHGS
jgi:type I site-specific restriction-modification system R (restriction) subunit